MNRNLKFNAYLLLYKKCEGSQNISKMVADISTYLPYVNTLYIFNYNEDTPTFLIEELKKKNKSIEYAKSESKGQVNDYISAMNHSKNTDADYVTIIEEGYYYEDDSYKDIKRRIMEGGFENASVITPIPIYTNNEKNDVKEEYRKIKGAHLTGAFINKHIYFETNGFFAPYYRTTFDYDYCLETRQKGYDIILFNNLMLRNRNFVQIQKTILWHTYYAYHHDIYDIYYETRNRLYLWEKYRKFDPEYVRIDKKQQSFEFKEIKLFEKKFSFIKEVIQQAKEDYRKGKLGKSFEEIKY